MGAGASSPKGGANLPKVMLRDQQYIDNINGKTQSYEDCIAFFQREFVKSDLDK
jgi:hypothetical protein